MLVDGPRDAHDDRCTLATHSSAALILAGDDCAVLLANPAACGLLGRTLPEAQGRRACDLLGLAPAEEPAHAHRCPIARLVRGQERRNGPREVILTVAMERIPALLAVDRPASGAAGAIVSIMPQHHEEHLQEQRRRVFARLLHDLRTPLSGIGLVTALLQSGGAEMPHSVLDAVRMHHADLLRYVGELADYALLDLH